MLDLDAKPCVICTFSIPYLTEFISKKHAELSKRLSSDVLYQTIHALVIRNRDSLKRQRKFAPEISEEDIKRHYTEHEISLASVLVEDLRAVRKLQSQLLKQPNPPISQVLQLSRTSVQLLKRLDEIKILPTESSVYKFET